MSIPPALEALENTHRLIVRSLGIKSTPPAYRKIVGTLADLMAVGFVDDVGPEILLLISGMLDASELPTKAGRTRRARSLLRKFADRTTAAGESYDKPRAQQIGTALASAYSLGRREVARGLGMEADFSLKDQDVIAGMHDAGLFWIGDFYGRWAGDQTLRDTVTDVIARQGLGREAAGKALREALGSHVERTDAYWRGLAATVATRARSLGAIGGMVDTGAISYEYVNPMDARTSPVCRRLDGQVFSVKGAMEIRERFLWAKDPAEAKEITPWPTEAQLLASDGSTKSSQILQASGIAWPPLHFHCRSTIDVSSWGPMPDHTDDLGDIDLEPKIRRKRKRKPKAPTVPDDVVTPGATPWATAKAALDRAEADVAAAGLAPDRFWVSDAFRADMLTHMRTVRAARTAAGVSSLAPLLMRRVAAGTKGGSKDLRNLLDTLGSGDWSDAALQARLQSEIDLLHWLDAAYRQAAATAPRDWHDAEHRRWSLALLNDQIPKSWKKVDKLQATENYLRGTSTFRADLLRLLVVEGERHEHNGRNKRAYASPAGFGSTGAITTNLGELKGSRVGAWEIGTIAHEWAHRLDGVMGGKGVTGRAWVSRPGYEDMPALHATTFRAPFDATKIGGIEKMPGEKTSKYRWAGRWVDTYEARIYSGGAKPDAAFLAGELGTGPIEFITMAGQYRSEVASILRDDVLGLDAATFNNPTTFGAASFKAVNDQPGVAGRIVGRLFRPGERMAVQLRTARQFYGTAYRDGQERLYGDGARFLQDLSDKLPAGSWSGDGDAFVVAMIFHDRYGVPLIDSLGPEGILRRHLSRDYDGPEIDAVTSLLMPGAELGTQDERDGWAHAINILGALK